MMEERRGVREGVKDDGGKEENDNEGGGVNRLKDEGGDYCEK